MYNPLNIYAPCFRSEVENTAFSAYAYHQQKIEDFIKLLSAASDPNDYRCQIEAAVAVGLDYRSLTSDEINYIEREVAKRL